MRVRLHQEQDISILTGDDGGQVGCPGILLQNVAGKNSALLL